MRPHRLNISGLVSHVTARGNNRQEIFHNAIDRMDYLSRLETAFAEQLIRLLSWCLMSNHVHLLVQDAHGGRLGRAMHKLQGGYAQAWNRRHNRTGSIYERRYHQTVVATDHHLAQASIYIHNNPVRAGLVARAEEYLWSSARDYLGLRSAPPAVHTDLVMGICGTSEEYLCMLRTWELEEDKKDLRSGLTRGQQFLGTVAFQDEIEKVLNRREERRIIDRRPQGLTIEEIWKEVERETGFSQEEVRSLARRSSLAEARAIFCQKALREGIVTARIAAEIQRSSSAVSHLARRRREKSRL